MKNRCQPVSDPSEETELFEAIDAAYYIEEDFDSVEYELKVGWICVFRTYCGCYFIGAYNFFFFFVKLNLIQINQLEINTRCFLLAITSSVLSVLTTIQSLSVDVLLWSYESSILGSTGYFQFCFSIGMKTMFLDIMQWALGQLFNFW